jgi:hypothetical protein
VTTPDGDDRALLGALERVYGAVVTPEWIEDFAVEGWTPSTVREVEHLAVLGHRAGTPCNGASMKPPSLYPCQPWSAWFVGLAEFAGYLHQRTGQPVSALVPWLAVVAGARDNRSVSAIRKSFSRTADGTRALAPQHRLFTAWQSAAPARWAALGWMAGLSPQETHDGHAAGSLDAHVLAGLATVRGFFVAPLLFADPQTPTPAGARTGATRETGPHLAVKMSR